MDRADRLPGRGRGVPRAAALIVLVVAFAACATDRTPELLGTWQAAVLLEEGDTVDVDLANVSLAFAPDQRYIYTSTLDHLESGVYTLEGDLLTTTSEVADGPGPQRVRVVLLDSARLQLLMMDKGRERRLEFARVGLTAPPPPPPGMSEAIDSSLLFEENFDEEDFGEGEAIDDHGHEH